MLFGDDKIFGEAGADILYGGLGDDKIDGGDDDDMLSGGAGEDIIYGKAGDDTLMSGSGWDTLFGGDGCDTIVSLDGGDVIWLGDCDGSADQKVSIYGTGDNPENFTVVMDYWLTPQWNEICIHESMNQVEPSTGSCDTNGNGYNSGFCLTAGQIADPSILAGSLSGGSGSYRGSGCKNDGGPLWISIPILDDPVVANSSQSIGGNFSLGGNPYPMSVWARFF